MFQNRYGETVFDMQGNPYVLTDMIGFGGQGTVYEEESGTFVVKIANIRNPAHRFELERRYDWLIKRKFNEGVIKLMVVPEAILAPPEIGYVMRRVKGLQPLSALLKCPGKFEFGKWYNIHTGGLRRRLRLGALIARAFYYIQLDGLAYCDLSATNILVAKDPSIVSICLIDSDNLSVSGNAESLVLGTPHYMAPEIVKGSHQPDSLTDSFSLAVILFQLLCLVHPFIGDQIYDASPEEEQKAFRGEFPYIHHPDDNSNLCSYGLPVEHVFTTRLSELFQKAFVDGLHVGCRTKRPTPGDFEEACVFASYETTKCDNCLATFFPKPETEQPEMCKCPWCETLKIHPPHLQFYDEVDMGSRQVKRTLAMKILLKPGENPIIQRFLSRNRNVHTAQRAIAKIQWNIINNEISIENQADHRLYIRNPLTKLERKLQKAEVQLIENGTVIYLERRDYGKPGQVKTVRCAKLIIKKGRS